MRPLNGLSGVFGPVRSVDSLVQRASARAEKRIAQIKIKRQVKGSMVRIAAHRGHLSRVKNLLSDQSAGIAGVSTGVYVPGWGGTNGGRAPKVSTQNAGANGEGLMRKIVQYVPFVMIVWFRSF